MRAVFFYTYLPLPECTTEYTEGTYDVVIDCQLLLTRGDSGELYSRYRRETVHRSVLDTGALSLQFV